MKKSHVLNLILSNLIWHEQIHNNKRSIATLVILLLFSADVAAQNDHPYDFPVKPGDSAWKEFKNSGDMHRACQIPSDLLHTMSTKALILTCLNYPLINTMYAYNDLQTGFERLTEQFNGFQELLSRHDSGRELLIVYSNMSPDAFNHKWESEKIGKFTLSFSYLETILAQPAIQSALSLDERKQMVKLCIKQYNKKEDHIDVFGSHGTSTSAWVVARVLDYDGRLQPEQNGSKEALAQYAFTRQGLVIDPMVVNGILEKAKSYTE